MKITILFVTLVTSLFSFAQTTDKSDFQYCPDLPIWPYYRFGELNDKSFREISTYFREDYEASKMKLLPNNNGIITVQFKINCNGEAGKFNAFSCDLSYNKNEIHPEIIEYFLQKTKNLGGWKKVVDADGVIANTHKFYSFRIVNGELTEILPK
jgi:hypothetical protein